MNPIISILFVQFCKSMYQSNQQYYYAFRMHCVISLFDKIIIILFISFSSLIFYSPSFICNQFNNNYQFAEIPTKHSFYRIRLFSVHSVTEELRTVMGSEVTRKGALKVFTMLQSQRFRYRLPAATLA